MRGKAILRRCSNCWSKPRRPPWPTRALLLRLEDGHAGWLDELLERIDCRRHLMLLFSPWPLPRLGEHLRSCTQAEWNRGRSSGVLRFYDPGLFMAVSDMLDPGRAVTCMPRFPAGTGWTATAGRGRWPVITRPTDAAAASGPPPGSASSRRLARLERGRSLPPRILRAAREHGLGGQESLLQHLVQAHLAADRQGLQDFDQRDAFVAQWLREQTPGSGFSPAGTSRA
ncbi:DUF4123 domain-containing protein [Pseudomonas aeruginosa]|nr:DUF4123 domain-containing protein [Pseudomonas aeruginosa]